jgi:hypothetical protein
VPSEGVHSSPSRTPARPVGPAARRLVYSLALLPIVPAVSIVGVSAVGHYIGLGSWDEFRWFHLFFPILWTTALILIWRGAVTWTLGRAWRTALVSMIPFVQVAVGLPLWAHSGCLASISDNMLRVGQHQILAGRFVWLAMWVWWGVEKAMMTPQGTTARHDNHRIIAGPVGQGMLASVASIPIVVGVFFIFAVSLEDLFGISDPWLGFALTAVVAMSIWLLIWGRRTVWSPSSLRRLALTAVSCFAVPITVCAMLFGSGSEVVSVVVVCLPIIGWGVWMAAALPMGWLRGGTLLDEEAEAGPRCLRCGYLLKGLTATRCPECGDERTLDELWAASLTDL